ncbi:MAG: hypothetical protein CL526_08735 [Aequorivita sp.]|nr:hypothetical protein [Aequorivita sp.]|tara:strand:+ start:59174 stop:59983 length:810 start_codon:yes stop_codon:yes gene_type:complete
MKQFITLLFIICLTVTYTYAQVGIGTVRPKSDLHISGSNSDGGSIQIDGGIRLGGDENTKGSLGNAGQFLMSTGGEAKWVSVGKFDDYFSDCAVPQRTATINFSLPDGSNGNDVNVTAFQVANALNSLPEGGIIVLKTNTTTTYSSNVTRLTVALPSASAVLGKPFVLAFDGAGFTNNSLAHNKSIEILVKATENNSYLYELSTVSSNRKFFIKRFPNNNNDYKISELDNNSGSTRRVLLFNTYTIKAIDDKTWAFTTRDCYVQNPRRG